MLRKISEKQREKNKIKKELTLKQWEFFKEIWNERPHICGNCNRYLGTEPLSLYFDHLIEKSSHSELRFAKKNILLVCGDCHSRRTNGFPGLLHKIAIENAKKELLS